MTQNASPGLERPPIDLISFLQASAENLPEGKVLFGHLIAALGYRSFGVAIMIFAIPMILPMPPGIPLSAGFVIAILGFQLLLGRPYLSLPKSLNEKTIDKKFLLGAYDFADRFLGWMFRLAKPRFPKITGAFALRASGIIFIILGGLMILPIPLVGNIFPAISCTIIALGLTDRDGIIFVLGILMALVTAAGLCFMSLGMISFISKLF